MDEDLRALLDRADRAIAESKRLAEENSAWAYESRRWFDRLHWQTQEMKPIARPIQK